MSEITKEATQEQLLYANILEKGMLIGLGLMFITFGLYVFGIMKPVVPLDQIAAYWSMPVGDYLAAINHNFMHMDHAPTGWAWLHHLGKGDFLNFLPVAILSGVTIVCYIAIVPGLFARNDKAMGLICMATAVILILAASGLLAVGH
ncbi:MAG: hypothetical protein OEY01_08235 [Desulfobulbaceae bacterium]|nr:hypothetical protein [Desulfobulbaceae bacterium]HIJ78991.1 DUF1634 domain-containing protein [Deltaproteobacteria bacterium]